MTWTRWIATAGLLLAGSAPAFAGSFGVESVGVHGGVSKSPDQFHGGLFADMGRPFAGVHVRPAVELGWGNGVVLFAANADALLRFRRGAFRPYGGGGLGLNFIDVTNGVGQGRGFEIEPVLNLVGGVEWGRSRGVDVLRYLAEARVGLGDTPELKVSFGLRF